MSLINAYTDWQEYCARELAVLTPELLRLGYSLDNTQPHLSGERYLMQAMTSVSGRKLILVGRRTIDDTRVIIKSASDSTGKAELIHERTCREVLNRIGFAYQTFHSPEELGSIDIVGRTVTITRFIEQGQAFIERPLKEQFDFALAAFKAQEGAHATTASHFALVQKTFGSMGAQDYLDKFIMFKQALEKHHPPGSDLIFLCTRGLALLRSNTFTLQQYAGFLTHIDFVPHNFRIVEKDIYLLDHSSMRFGNKYEGWARFVNFMSLYNPLLASSLIQYVRDNRTNEESLALKLMRVYRLGEIIMYYQNTLDKSTGNLLTLNTARLNFWKNVFCAVLDNEDIPKDVRMEYISLRDSLRSDEEKIRQQGLH